MKEAEDALLGDALAGSGVVREAAPQFNRSYFVQKSGQHHH